MIKQLLTASLCLSASALTGCATVVNGTHQTVTVATTPEVHAECQLQNNKGNWSIASTPESIKIHRSYEPLNIICKKPGYAQTSPESVGSNTKTAAFGNIALGGLIGAGTDMADGAAYGYPDKINVPMKKSA